MHSGAGAADARKSGRVLALGRAAALRSDGVRPTRASVALTPLCTATVSTVVATAMLGPMVGLHH